MIFKVRAYGKYPMGKETNFEYESAFSISESPIVGLENLIILKNIEHEIRSNLNIEKSANITVYSGRIMISRISNIDDLKSEALRYKRNNIISSIL